MEVQHFQARAACHHYAGKKYHSGLLVRGCAHALERISQVHPLDANLQASHLRAKLRYVRKNGGTVQQRAPSHRREDEKVRRKTLHRKLHIALLSPDTLLLQGTNLQVLAPACQEVQQRYQTAVQLLVCVELKSQRAPMTAKLPARLV